MLRDKPLARMGQNQYMTGYVFRQIRLRAGLSQRVLAVRVGVTKRTIQRWERKGPGKVPRYAALALLQVWADGGER